MTNAHTVLLRRPPPPPIEVFRSAAEVVEQQPHAPHTSSLPWSPASESALQSLPWAHADFASAPIFDELEVDEDAFVTLKLSRGEMEAAGGAAWLLHDEREDEPNGRESLFGVMAATGDEVAAEEEEEDEDEKMNAVASRPCGPVQSSDDEGSDSEVMLIEELSIAGAVLGLPTTPHFRSVAGRLGTIRSNLVAVGSGAAPSSSSVDALGEAPTGRESLLGVAAAAGEVVAAAEEEEDEKMNVVASRPRRPAESSDDEGSDSEVIVGESSEIAGAVLGLPRTPHFRTVAGRLGTLRSALVAVGSGAAPSSSSVDALGEAPPSSPTSPHMRIREAAATVIMQLSAVEGAWVGRG